MALPLLALAMSLAITAVSSSARAASPDPKVGLFSGEGIKVELAAAGKTDRDVPRYVGRVDVEGRRLRVEASGFDRLNGLMGEGDGAILFTFEVVGDQATFRYSGKTVTLRRGAVLGADAPPPPPSTRPEPAPAPPPPAPDRVVVNGTPPLTQTMIDAHVEVNEWLLQLLLEDYELTLDVAQRAALAQQLITSYPRLSPAQRQHFASVPGIWSQTRDLWRWVGAEGRKEVADTYRARWLAAQQAAMAKMQLPQRQAQQLWLRVAEAMRRGDLTGAEKLMADNAAQDRQWRRTVDTAQRTRAPRGSGPGGRWTAADTRRQMGRNMTYHFVQTNMANMTTNMFLTGSP